MGVITFCQREGHMSYRVLQFVNYSTPGCLCSSEMLDAVLNFDGSVYTHQADRTSTWQTHRELGDPEAKYQQLNILCTVFSFFRKKVEVILLYSWILSRTTSSEVKLSQPKLPITAGRESLGYRWVRITWLTNVSRHANLYPVGCMDHRTPLCVLKMKSLTQSMRFEGEFFGNLMMWLSSVNFRGDHVPL